MNTLTHSVTYVAVCQGFGNARFYPAKRNKTLGQNGWGIGDEYRIPDERPTNWLNIQYAGRWYTQQSAYRPPL